MDYTNLEDLKPQIGDASFLHYGLGGVAYGQQLQNYQKDRQLHEYLNELNKQEATQKTKEYLTTAPTRMAQQLLLQKQAEANIQTLPEETKTKLLEQTSKQETIPSATALGIATNVEKTREVQQAPYMQHVTTLSPYGSQVEQIYDDKDMTPQQKQQALDSITKAARSHMEEMFPDKPEFLNKIKNMSDRDLQIHLSNMHRLATQTAEQQQKEKIAEIQKLDPMALRVQAMRDVANTQAEAKKATARIEVEGRIQTAKIQAADRKSMGSVVQGAIDSYTKEYINQGKSEDEAKVLANYQVMNLVHQQAGNAFNEAKADQEFINKYMEKNYLMSLIMQGKNVGSPEDAMKEVMKFQDAFKEHRQSGGTGTIGTPMVPPPRASVPGMSQATPTPTPQPTAVPPNATQVPNPVPTPVPMPPPPKTSMADQIPGNTPKHITKEESEAMRSEEHTSELQSH